MTVINADIRRTIISMTCSSKAPPHRNIVSIAPEEFYDDIVGDTEYLEEKHSLSPSKIEKKINRLLSSIEI